MDKLVAIPELDSVPAELLARNSIFLSGPFGSGKTTAAIARVRWLLSQERIRGDDILVLVPQRTLGKPYQEALKGPDVPPGPPVRISTFAGLARSAVELYWPLVAPDAGFADPRKEPTFLNLETAQYHMARFVENAFEQGEFDAIRLQRGRVVSQVLDNLNKAALHGFSIDEAYERLELAVPQGEQMTARINVLRSARRISRSFRNLCLEESLVDFSLWIRLFQRNVLANEWSRTHLFRTHQHLIFDNAEEDTFAAHDLVARWIPHLQSALVLVDDDAGYRVFLGADPESAVSLVDAGEINMRLGRSRVMPDSLYELTRLVDRVVGGSRGAGGQSQDESEGEIEGVGFDEESSQPANDYGEDGAVEGTEPPLHYSTHRFYPQMIDWVVDEIEGLIENDGVSPGGIVVLAPFVSDALRFSLQTRLQERGIASTTHRPSRALNAEPAARALITLADLAHPLWQRYPPPADVTLMLGLIIDELDPVRAHLLSRKVYGTRGTIAGSLRRFSELSSNDRQRITFGAGERYDRLRTWLDDYRSETEFTPLDQFFARIFGELLSQPGFGFRDDVDGARVASQLVDSARNFRWAIEEQIDDESAQQSDGVPLRRGEIGRFYVELVESGALGALYVPGWSEEEDVVFISPAYTYLMRNRPVDVQFWLDVGSSGWWERLYQPLTHPYVLSRRWPSDQIWTDFDEFNSRQETMRRLLTGLARRTRRAIYLAMSDYGESGMEQRGPLLGLLNRVLVQGENRVALRSGERGSGPA